MQHNHSATNRPSREGLVFLAVGVFFLLGVFFNVLGKHTRETEVKETAEKHSAAVDEASKLPPQQILKELQDIGEDITSKPEQLGAIRVYLEAAQKVRGSYKPREQQTIDRIQKHIEWGQWLAATEYDIPATAKCRVVVQQRMKAPDSVEWKGQKSAFDPDEDYVLYVFLQANAMNSFGAKLLGNFQCSLKCNPNIRGAADACVVTEVTES